MKKAVEIAVVLSAALTALPSHATQILGIDVSSYNGTINWSSVHADGIVFAYARATEGITYEDTSFASFMNGGKAAGLQMGAYSFSHPYADTPAQEANYFWNYAGSYIKADSKSISPAIDFEVFSGHDGAPSYTAWFNSWAADVKAKTTNSMAPVIYVSPCNGACDLATNITLGGWIANTGGSVWSACDSCNVWDVGGTGGWTYWQSNDTGSVSGISGYVDLDVYPGTLASLKSKEGIGGL